ncbi:hypothetical protein B6D60_07890 [candidate division KSB1 bacterium 4484_87]|nr:MAG: hypothetical protein B6D60_07890 [candidate division KSB1 bacterium 4484_87]
MPESKERTITQIVVQKKRKNRCSIFLDGEFGFGLHQDVVFKFGLKKGDVLDDGQIKKIIFAEEKKKAFDRAIKILSHRDRSEHEMRNRLLDAGYEEMIVELVVTDLLRLGLIDDEKFSRLFARTKMMTKPMGSFLLKRELKQKGIAEEIVEKTIDEIYRENNEYEVAQKIAKKKKRQLTKIEEAKAKKKVSDLLARRGFSWDIISHVLEHWQELDEEIAET